MLVQEANLRQNVQIDQLDVYGHHLQSRWDYPAY